MYELSLVVLGILAWVGAVVILTRLEHRYHWSRQLYELLGLNEPIID